MNLSEAILLNDEHRWTRERIAEWIATIEPKEDVISESALNAEISHLEQLVDNYVARP